MYAEPPNQCVESFEKWYAENLRGRRTLARFIWEAAWKAAQPTPDRGVASNPPNDDTDECRKAFEKAALLTPSDRFNELYKRGSDTEAWLGWRAGWKTRPQASLEGLVEKLEHEYYRACPVGKPEVVISGNSPSGHYNEAITDCIAIVRTHEPAPQSEEFLLPYDVKIGATVFRKGVKLTTLVSAAERWNKLATEPAPKPSADMVERVAGSIFMASEDSTSDGRKVIVCPAKAAKAAIAAMGDTTISIPPSKSAPDSHVGDKDVVKIPRYIGEDKIVRAIYLKPNGDGVLKDLEDIEIKEGGE